MLQLVVGISVLVLKPFGVLPVIFLLSVFFAGFIFANYFVRVKIGNRKEKTEVSSQRSEDMVSS